MRYKLVNDWGDYSWQKMYVEYPVHAGRLTLRRNSIFKRVRMMYRLNRQYWSEKMIVAGIGSQRIKLRPLKRIKVTIIQLK